VDDVVPVEALCVLKDLEAVVYRPVVRVRNAPRISAGNLLSRVEILQDQRVNLRDGVKEAVCFDVEYDSFQCAS
jgi:hypothetical protein